MKLQTKLMCVELINIADDYLRNSMAKPSSGFSFFNHKQEDHRLLTLFLNFLRIALYSSPEDRTVEDGYLFMSLTRDILKITNDFHSKKIVQDLEAVVEKHLDRYGFDKFAENITTPLMGTGLNYSQSELLRAFVSN